MKVRMFIPSIYNREEITKMISPTYQFYHHCVCKNDKKIEDDFVWLPPGGEVHNGPRDRSSDAGGLSKFSWPSSSCAWNQSLGPVSVCKMFVCRLFDRICGLQLRTDRKKNSWIQSNVGWKQLQLGGTGSFPKAGFTPTCLNKQVFQQHCWQLR